MRFKVFSKGKEVKKFKLCGAYLFGTDGIAIRRAKISFKNGLVICDKPNLETSGLVLLWPVEGFGRIMLPTTTLPERPEPYNLNVEIARAKIKQILVKCEDWSFFHTAEGLGSLFDECRKLFIEAVKNISDAQVASTLADESLKKALIFSEKLAAKQADSLFQTRGKNRGFGRGCIGCRVDLDQIDNSKYVETLLTNFNSITIPLNWALIERNEGEFDYSIIDKCITVLSKKKVAVSAGPLLLFSKDLLPGWLLESKAGFEQIRDKAYRFICNVVSRYCNGIRAWEVVSGLNAFNYLGFNFEQALEMTRAATMAVRASSERAFKIVGVSNPWGEYYSTKSGTIPPLVYMDMVVQSGISFDAFGVSMRFGKDESGMHVRDMMQISAMLDNFGHVAKPLYVTDVQVPSSSGDDAFDGEVAGIWRQKWSQGTQALWIEQFYRIAMSKSFVDKIIYSNLTDTPNAAIENSGLFNDDLTPKKSFDVLRKVRSEIFGRVRG